jgi:hypothetical protein
VLGDLTSPWFARSGIVNVSAGRARLALRLAAAKAISDFQNRFYFSEFRTFN